jgi:hypothetical protein
LPEEYQYEIKNILLLAESMGKFEEKSGYVVERT